MLPQYRDFLPFLGQVYALLVFFFGFWWLRSTYTYYVCVCVAYVLYHT